MIDSYYPLKKRSRTMQRRSDKLAQIFNDKFEQGFLTIDEHLKKRKTTCEVLIAHWHDEMSGWVRFLVSPEKLKKSVEGIKFFPLDFERDYAFYYIVIFENDIPMAAVPITDRDVVRFILVLHHDDNSLKDYMEEVII